MTVLTHRILLGFPPQHLIENFIDLSIEQEEQDVGVLRSWWRLMAF
jgi:hypothetical protein